MCDVPDETAIRYLVERDCDAARRADLKAFAACWAAEGRWTGPGLNREGIHAITGTFGKMRARVATTDPRVVSGSATIDADGAHPIASWEIREHIVGHDGSDRDTVGRYDDEYARVLGDWRFRSRHFTPSTHAPRSSARTGRDLMPWSATCAYSSSVTPCSANCGIRHPSQIWH